MASDLYKIDLQRTSSADLYASVKAFTATNLPLDERPREGYLLDFKQEWGDKALQTVAGFANAFGGILIVGVSENDARPEEVVGVECPGELKIRLASSIAANIAPCPVFEIGECHLPDLPDRKVCVVRVMESAELCLIARKGIGNPAYVRVEDQSKPADASQLRQLIKRKASREDYPRNLGQVQERWRSDLFVTRASPNPVQRTRSTTFMQATLLPVEHPQIEVDVAIERTFFELVDRIFGGLDALDFEIELGPRSKDSFKIRRLDRDNDFERLWSFNSSGCIGFATQISWAAPDGGLYWSLADLVLDLSHLITAAREFWKGFGYYGRASLQVQMNVQGLDILFGPQGFLPMLYRPGNPVARDAVAVREHYSEANQTLAKLDLSHTDDVACVLSRAVNQVLRYLGHGADLERLERSISAVIPAEQ